MQCLYVMPVQEGNAESATFDRVPLSTSTCFDHLPSIAVTHHISSSCIFMMTTTAPPDFLIAHLPARDDPSTSSRPHITVTWAQSLDAKIAGVGGSRVILSGPESMLMTHWYVSFPRQRFQAE